MADHNKPVPIDPGTLPLERPQGAVAIGESPNHESSAVELRPIVTTTIAILLIVLISDAGLWVLYKFWEAREVAADRAETPLLAIRPDMAGPKLQVDEPSNLHHRRAEDVAPIEGYKWVEPGKVASVPVEVAIDKIAAAAALPSGPDWSLKPDERMVGGVILNPDQVKYANTPPSQALVGEPGASPLPGQVGTAPLDHPTGTTAPQSAPVQVQPAPAPPKATTKPAPKPAAKAAPAAGAQR